MSKREAANEKAMGSRKYRERIHKESKFADDHKNLPFTFSKPTKSKPRNTLVRCGGCGREFWVTETTVLSICGQCKAMVRTKDCIVED